MEVQRPAEGRAHGALASSWEGRLCLFFSPSFPFFPHFVAEISWLTLSFISYLADPFSLQSAERTDHAALLLGSEVEVVGLVVSSSFLLLSRPKAELTLSCCCLLWTVIPMLFSESE